MNRFFTEKLNDSMILSGDNHSHIAYSLRLKIGDGIILFCGDGFDYRYKITNIKKNETSVVFLDKEENGCESVVSVHAFISLIKHDKMSFIYQKLTELGVNSFFPVVTGFSQGKKGDFNAERYSRICIEACKQCGRSVVPKVNNPLRFDELPTVFKDYDTVIFAYEKAENTLKENLVKTEKENPVKAVKENLITEGENPVKAEKENLIKAGWGDSAPKRVAVLIGPEGGFLPTEAETLQNCGIKPVSLGKRILRAETAAIAAVSAVLYELDW